MVALKEYLLSVTAAALICGVLGAMESGKSFCGILSLISGAFLIFTVTAPIFSLSLQEIPMPDAFMSQDPQPMILEGVDYAAQAKARIITQELTAYIEDKARLYGAVLTAEICLAQDGVPESVRITGTWSGYARKNLEQILERDLGIPKEKQLWTQLPSS